MAAFSAMPPEAEPDRLAAGFRQIREAESRCLALRHRLLHSHLPPSTYHSLLRLLDAELRSLSRLACSDPSIPLSSNVGYLESIARILLHPSIHCVSRVSRPVPAVASDRPVHVDLICTFHRRPAWFVVSDRNPSFLPWLGLKGLRTRAERIVATARAAGVLKPASVLFVFSRGVLDHLANNLVDEFGAFEVNFFKNEDEDAFEELEDGWVGVRWSGTVGSRVFEIKISNDDEIAAIYCTEAQDVREDLGESDDRFELLISKMSLDSADVMNFDTTALVAMVSGISNGGCERLMKAPEVDLRARFKGNYEFVMAQVTSELQRPILEELDVAICGKKGIICESVHAEFKELVSMCGGHKEKLRAGQLIKHLQIVPDSPSERVMNLPTTRKMALKNKIVFGTGDRWHAPTLTANMGFVRAVSQTSMSLLTVEHKPRALTGD